MKRRDLIAGAVSVAGLAAANKVLAEPGAAPTEAKTAKPAVTEATVQGIYQATSKAEGVGETTAPVVILKARDQERYLPIWIGALESYSIAFGLDNSKPSRPMSHDLMAELIKALRGRVEAVYVMRGADEHTFYSTIKVVGNGIETEVDSRPSDALALALRVKTPIFVATDLMKQTTLDEIKIELRQK
ncbi:MAG: bifunctional nuclease family protein [Abitibacteriaceae bacterium]|nr:bifunctional nuclease family protein [Abditibacteriaceae bacterium]MBV9867084.1 bifunctional nuclease family protein [Abditibacteriaceae bacterium]